MKSVLYFSDAPYVGGAEKYLLLLAKHIGEFGYKPAFILDKEDRLKSLVKELEDEGIEVFGVDINLPYSPRGLPELTGLLRRIKPDIFHLNLSGPYSAKYGLVAPVARLCGVKRIVSTEHLPMVEPFFKGKFLKSVSNIFIDRVITVSENNVQFLVGKHGVKRGKVRVVYLGIPDIFPELRGGKKDFGLSDRDIVITMIASIEERKGHRVAIRALEVLPPNHHLLIVGTGPLEAELMDLVESLGMQERVHFLGYTADVSRVLAATDVVLLTSFLEATPYVLIEAMAAGIPVVASDIFGVGEIVEDSVTGILVPPGDAKRTAEAIRAIIQDGEKRERMSKAARERYLKHFRLESFVSETAAVYNELLG